MMIYLRFYRFCKHHNDSKKEENFFCVREPKNSSGMIVLHSTNKKTEKERTLNRSKIIIKQGSSTKLNLILFNYINTPQI